MKWQKPDGRIMDCQDNEATEKELLRLGCKKIGSDAPEVGEPEEDTDADGQPNPPEQEPEQETVEITEDEMPSQSHPESISPDEVGEMPKDILGG